MNVSLCRKPVGLSDGTRQSDEVPSTGAWRLANAPGRRHDGGRVADDEFRTKDIF
jgi:hypothetical protein